MQVKTFLAPPIWLSPPQTPGLDPPLIALICRYKLPLWRIATLAANGFGFTAHELKFEVDRFQLEIITTIHAFFFRSVLFSNMVEAAVPVIIRITYRTFARVKIWFALLRPWRKSHWVSISFVSLISRRLLSRHLAKAFLGGLKKEIRRQLLYFPLSFFLCIGMINNTVLQTFSALTDCQATLKFGLSAFATFAPCVAIRSPSGKCAKLHTVAASNNRVHSTRSLYCCLFAPHIYGCYSSRASHSWWTAHSAQRQRRGCNTCLYVSNLQIYKKNKEISKTPTFSGHNTSPVTSLGHQEGRTVFWKRPKFFELCPIFSNYIQHIFPGRVKNFLRGEKPLSCYGPAWTCISILSSLSRAALTLSLMAQENIIQARCFEMKPYKVTEFSKSTTSRHKFFWLKNTQSYSERPFVPRHHNMSIYLQSRN